MALRPAFLLSIVATSAILSAPGLGRAGVAERVRSAAVISARTLVGTTPMVWWWFGGVPLVGWLTNIVVLPLGAWVVVPLAHLAALSAWIPRLSEPLGAALELAVDALLAACDAFAPLAVTGRLPPLDPAQGLIVAGGCALLLLSRSWRQRGVLLLGSAALWLCAEHALIRREQPRELLRVTFVDVGQGDAALIDFPDGRSALIDTGQGGRHPAGRELRGLLAARRRSRVDLVAITHGHPDHYGGLEALLDEVEVGEIWLNGQLLSEEREPRFEALLNDALEAGTHLRFAPDLCGKTHYFGEAQIELLWPCPGYDAGLDLNDNSLTMRLGLRETSFLFTGDLERDAEERLLEAGLVEPVDVLKVAHHGSRTSSTEAFLDATRPSLAIISCGAGNRYGHPDPGVLERLRGAGASVLRTDQRGGVIVQSDGERLSVRR
jgi:competence protein ComEC